MNKTKFKKEELELKLANIGCNDITTSRQRKNGTQVIELNTSDGPVVFGLYEAGYVRRLPSRGNRWTRMYYINRRNTKKVSKIEVTFDDNSSIEMKDSNTWVIKRLKEELERGDIELLLSPEERLEYLFDFIKRNYDVGLVKSKYRTPLTDTKQFMTYKYSLTN